VASIAITLLIAIAFQVGFGLRPLRRVAATLERMRRGEAVRFEPADLPAEIAPLARDMNQLLDEHDRRVAHARHSADDLAHALKTPLAALALETESTSGEFAQRVAVQVQRLRDVVERRLSGGVAADSRQRTALQPLLESLLAALRRVYAERGLRWEAAATEAVFAGNREDLADMLGNLLENAGKWARSEVTVRVVAHAAGLRIVVEDDGPGLAPEQMAQALQRGVRLDERAPGSGLGLSIVDEIARSYGGDLRLARSAAGGLRAELHLPPAPA
jgi:signal transduction histidine kinase